MTNFFGRLGAKYNNQIKQSCAELVGLAEGILADQQLNDHEIQFLNRWLATHQVIANEWPGDVLYAKVKDALADGVITEVERSHLAATLNKLVGGHLEQLAEQPLVNQLALDAVEAIVFSNSRFCFTGDFAFAPRAHCMEETQRKGGLISESITKKLNYLVVGGLGSDEWKHGSFGTKIEKAIEYKRAGVPIFIVHEDVWTSGLR